MDILLKNRLRQLETKTLDDKSIVENIREKIELLPDSLKVEENNNDDDKRTKNLILFEQYLQYHQQLNLFSSEYSQIEDILEYISKKHRNIIIIGTSMLSQHDMFKRELYLNQEQSEDFAYFVSWCKKNLNTE